MHPRPQLVGRRIVLTVTSACGGSTTGRMASVCGEIGVRISDSTVGTTIVPAERLYPWSPWVNETCNDAVRGVGAHQLLAVHLM